MEIGKTIEKLPLSTSVEGGMLIPTGGFGDLAVTVEQLKTFVETNLSVYLTDNPTLQSKNGKLQKLTLKASGKLTSDIPSGGFISLKVSGDYNLDISDFINVNGFVRDKRFQNAILIFNYLGEKLLIGSNYIESADEIPAPPNDVVTCEGASNYFDIFVYKADVGADPANPAVPLTIDGVLTDPMAPPPSWLTATTATTNPTPPVGYTLVISGKFINDDTVNHTFIVETVGNYKLFAINTSGTIIEVEPEKKFAFCLVPHV